MALPRCKIVLQGPALALAGFKTALDTAMLGMTVTRRTHDWTRLPLNGEDERILDVHLGVAGNLDTLHTFLAGRVAGLRVAGVRGRASVHLCSHDDVAICSCRDHADSQFREVLV